MLGGSTSAGGGFPGLGIIEGWLKAIANLLGTIASNIASAFPPALTSSVVYDPPNLASGASQITTVTVTGAVLGQRVGVSFSLDNAGTVFSGYVSAANTVTVVQSNLTGGAVNLGSGTLKVWSYVQ